MNYITQRPDAALTKSANRKRLQRKNKGQINRKHNFFSECGKRREKETQILANHNTFMKTHIVQQTKHQLRNDISEKMVFELQGMEPLIDEYNLQVDKKNKKGKILKVFEIGKYHKLY